MTFSELLVMLQQMQRVAPEKMSCDVMFLPMCSRDAMAAKPLHVRVMEYNDGSIEGIGRYQPFLSEV